MNLRPEALSSDGFLIDQRKTYNIPFGAVTSDRNGCGWIAGIIMYFAGRRNHFAAFRREETGKLRFFGATPGLPGETASMAEFYWNHVKFPLALTITVRSCTSAQNTSG